MEQIKVLISTMDQEILELFIVSPEEPMTPGALARALKEMIADYHPITDVELPR